MHGEGAFGVSMRCSRKGEPVAKAPAKKMMDNTDDVPTLHHQS
jgi:hypothetical protein